VIPLLSLALFFLYYFLCRSWCRCFTLNYSLLPQILKLSSHQNLPSFFFGRGIQNEPFIPSTSSSTLTLICGDALRTSDRDHHRIQHNHIHSNIESHLQTSLISLAQIAVWSAPEVTIVEMMHPHEPILSAWCVWFSRGVNSNPVQCRQFISHECQKTGKQDRSRLSEWQKDSRVDRSEMALDTTNLLLKDFMPETSLELSLSRWGSRDVHGFLSTAHNDLFVRSSVSKCAMT